MNKVYNKEELLDILKSYIQIKGEVPKQSDFKPVNGLPSFSVYFKNFGSLKNIYTLLGLKDINDKRFKKQYYTDEELLDILKIEVEKHLKTNSYLISEKEFNEHEAIPHNAIYFRRFGGIKNAYKLIGYNYDQYNKNILEKDMILKYKQLATELGHTPNSREIDRYSKLNKCYATKTYAEHFGSIYKLQILCGFTPTKMGINRTEKEMIDDLLKLADILDDIPTARDIDSCEFTCSVVHYIKKFGSMENILKTAGFPKNKIKRNYIITKHGTKCFSQYEYRLAKVIENNNIIFNKEAYYKDVIKNLNNNYKFDFVVEYKNKKYYIEVFGIEDNDNYYAKSKYKIDLCKENNLPLICFYPKEFWAVKYKDLYKLLISKIDNSVFYEYEETIYFKEVI